MFFKGKDKEINQTVINIPCSCGTHSINITYFNDEDQDVYLSFFMDKFYLQDGIFHTMLKRIKRAFLILCGKSYKLEEIVLPKEDLRALEQEIHNILNNKKEEK